MSYNPTAAMLRLVINPVLSAYPAIALREAVANALIHQDFSVTGTGVVVEIFSNRIEITNPGIPLVDIYRIVDNPPKSRNEKLASLMRRLRMKTFFTRFFYQSGNTGRRFFLHSKSDTQ